MKKFTINDIRSWKPCYDPSEHLPESWQGTALDILNDDSIPFRDRLWVIMRPDLVSERLMRRFAVWCARQVQHLMTDQRSLHALDVMEAYAENRWLIDDPDYAEAWEDERATAWNAAEAEYAIEDAARNAARAATRDTAWAAARNAARDAARGIAWDATRNAAWTVAQVTAWVATRDTARNIVWSAARDAAEATAWNAQEQKLREMLIAGIETGDTK